MNVLITGAAGQDGVIMSRKLINAGHKVFGICKPTQTAYLEIAVPGISIIEFDLNRYADIPELLSKFSPEVIVNLAGFSSVLRSWETPIKTFEINTLVPIQIIEWIFKTSPNTRFLQASSSEIFGGSNIVPQNEDTPLKPITPYGSSKAAIHELIKNFRFREGLHLSSAILYNHESPLRKLDFVTRHITNGVALIALGRSDSLKIGNVLMSRDWGWAPEYVDGMISVLNQSQGNDYVFATGKSHTVSEFIEASFYEVGIRDYLDFIITDESQIRRVDPSLLVGNAARAHSELGWHPSTKLNGIVSKMMAFELNFLNGNASGIWFE
jgi:GDPmannose 4,6-dehydratase